MVIKMLEKVIEIEGLLRIIRDGNPGPEVFKLLKEKSAELADEINRLENANETPAEKVGKLNDPIDMETQLEEYAEAPIEAPLEELEYEPLEELKEESEDESFEESVEEPLEEPKEESEEESFEESEEEPLEELKKESEEESFEESEERSINEDVQNSDEKNNVTEDDDILLTFDEEEAETEIGAPGIDLTSEPTPNLTNQATGAKKQTKLKSSFSLNDRFLYSRELFNGNMKMFDSTLEFIEGIEDFPIIEDYFYNELEWDPENMHVATFMEILRPNFRE